MRRHGMETFSALLVLCEGNHQSWLTGQCWCCIHKSLWLYWITRKLTSRIRLSTSEVTRASPGHYLENPYTGPWSPNCHGHGHEWPTPTSFVQCQSISHSEIQLFQNLTMKNLGQGYACGQRSRSHLTLEIQRSKSWPKSNPLVTFETWISIDMLITRVSEVIIFSPCVFVTLFFLFVSLSRCLSGRFNYAGLVPHKQYFAGTLLGMSSCASYVSRTHDVIDDVIRSQSRSNFESDISPSIFELERRSKARNVGNAHGYLSGLFNFRYNFR